MTPDLTLPPTAPSVGHFDDKPMELRPAALYTLVNLTDSDLQDLQEVCESETCTDILGSNVRLAPRPRFVGASLQDIYDHHLKQNEQNNQDPPLDPTHFIVAFTKDWKEKGVLLVTLDDHNLECKTDFFRIKPEYSGITFIGIRIGNIDWSEAKDLYSLPPDNTNSGDDHDNQSSPSEPTSPFDPGSPTSGPISPSSPAARDSTSIAVYAIPSLDYKELITTLEPNGSRKDPKLFNCRLQAILSSSNPTEEAMNLHPLRCSRNPFFHKFLFLIADTPDFMETGVLLASLGGKIKDKTFPERQTQRVACLASATTQDTICMMAQGLRPWTQPEGTYCIYVFRWDGMDGKKKQRPETVAPLLDTEWMKRVPGEERILFAGNRFERKEGKSGRKVKEWDLKGAVEKWPEICWEQRFRERFLRRYFVVVDNGDMKGEGVLLVRVDWNGDVAGEKEKMKVKGGNLVGDQEGRVETWRVEVGEALDVVKGVVEGNREWEGAVVDFGVQENGSL
ncbi:hypothetical protein QBC38DRAFT_143106 [Podospora fimiseda]|uniref:Uncharacterized protein n=1 Tax=Podospora fimiseda TaxID=252190 RepID=A0AAN6YNN2_9PEZI|nr:hypothetical protein QBC38DRAFT_143106 [Podospora fimiseda]